MTEIMLLKRLQKLQPEVLRATKGKAGAGHTGVTERAGSRRWDVLLQS